MSSNAAKIILVIAVLLVVWYFLLPLLHLLAGVLMLIGAIAVVMWVRKDRSHL